MNLPSAPPTYSQANESAARQAVSQADQLNRKTNEDVDLKGARLFLYDTAGKRYLVSVSTSGALSATAG